VTNDGRTFELNGRKFQLNKIDAFRQFHIVRRIGPLLADLILALKDIGGIKTENMSETQKLEHFSKIAAPLMSGLSKLSDADSEYVLFKLLSSVEVYQDQFKNWARVSTDTMIAMQDLELPVLLQVAGRALVYNLSGFFALLPRQG
jgi:tail assembly chaperone